MSPGGSHVTSYEITGKVAACYLTIVKNTADKQVFHTIALTFSTTRQHKSSKSFTSNKVPDVHSARKMQKTARTLTSLQEVPMNKPDVYVRLIYRLG
ncbi:hypothetical protein ACFX15_039088 [Malus domestica]